MLRELERRTREYFGDADASETADRPTHLDFICDWLSSGRTLRELARELATAAGFGERDFFGVLGNYAQHCEPNAEERIRAARLAGSLYFAEEVADIADEKIETKAEAARQRNRMHSRQWLAGAMNPELRPGKSNNVNVAIGGNVGALMLDAFRARTLQTGPTQTGGLLTTRTGGEVDPARIHAQQPRALPSQVVDVQEDTDDNNG